MSRAAVGELEHDLDEGLPLPGTPEVALRVASQKANHQQAKQAGVIRVSDAASERALANLLFKVLEMVPDVTCRVSSASTNHVLDPENRWSCPEGSRSAPQHREDLRLTRR